MSFSINGSTITQSGTDTDLSGLAAISGVTTTTYGSGSNTRKIYNIGTLKLSVTGALTNKHDTLIGSGANGNFLDIANGGTFTLGEEVSVTRGSGLVTVNAGTGKIILTKDSGTPFQAASFGFVIRSGGAFKQYGGYVELTNSLEVQSGATFLLRDAVWFMWTDTIIYLNAYLKSTGVDVNGWLLQSDGTALPGTLAAFTRFEGFKAVNCGYAAGSIDGDNNIRSFVKLTAGLGNYDVFHRATSDTAGYDIYGAIGIGNDLRVRGQGNSNQSRGRTRHFIQYKPTFVTASGAAISNVILYGVDSNSGSRSSVYESATRIYTPTAYTAGQLNAFHVLTGVWHNSGNINITDYTLDNRLPVALGFAHYGYELLGSSISDSLNYEQSPRFILVADARITQPDRAIVDAYTQIDSAAKLYDRAKSHLVANYAGQAAPYLTRSGASIDLGAYNLVIDAQAGAAFGVSGSTITIKATTFTGNLTTTGTITLQNGATVAGAVEDSSGVRVTLSFSAAANVLAKRSDTGAELGFSQGVTSVTYTLPRGVTLYYAAWGLGYNSIYGTYDTNGGGRVISPDLSQMNTVDTSLDVASLLDDLTVSIAPGQYNITFNAAMTAGIEQIKAVIHRLLGRETSLRALLGAGGMHSLYIRQDEIEIVLPVVFMRRGSALTATDAVWMDGFFNTVPAQAVTPAYEVNPVNADGLRVNILRKKPTIDPTQIAIAVKASLAQTLDAVKTDTAAIKVKTDTLVNGPTLAQIEATVETRASQASVTALGAPAQAADLVALATTNQTEHDTTQAAIAALPAPLDATQAQDAAAAAISAYAPATASDVLAAQAAVIAEVEAIPATDITPVLDAIAVVAADVWENPKRTINGPLFE